MTAPLLTEIDHVAIAVRDLEAAVAYYAETFGASVDHRERIETDGVEEALIRVADSYIQLLTPIRADSTVAKFLEKKGEGLHHVGYRVATARSPSSRSRTTAARSSTRSPAPDRGARRSPSFTRRAPSAP